MKTKKTRGRPRTLTAEKVKAVAEWIGKGVPEEMACIREGVNYGTFANSKVLNAEFREAVKKEQANFLCTAVTRIEAGLAGWQGCAWLLERRHKPHFNRTDTHALTDTKGGALMTDEEMRELSERTKKRVLRGVKE